MGAAFASSYANLFMGMWERDIFFSKPVAHIERVLFWARYIDDILMIWQGPEQDLLDFIGLLIHNPYNIKLSHKYSQTSIDFLDIEISGFPGGCLETNVYRKDTAVNSFLHASSSHPQPLISSIPVGQFLRAKRICSSEENFKEQANILTTRFQERGYSNRSIKRGLKRAEKANRTELLKQRTKTTHDAPVRFITTYNNGWRDMKTALTKYWPLLKIDKTLSKHLFDHPSITYKKSPNLKDQLIGFVSFIYTNLPSISSIIPDIAGGSSLLCNTPGLI
ncbi:unnamed protein product [Ranitomeya imitator]|uniref:Helix-turn-helix domain-containing protein n=1 Tax=Ranitomeya imitator TaxID=111125 RepID=A0ABN9M7S5_9NEOB|nr:unnamed protein product [Ranitomeya imitator]